jgi:hypothetical protein
MGQWAGGNFALRKHRDMTGARKGGLIMVRDDYVWLTK